MNPSEKELLSKDGIWKDNEEHLCVLTRVAKDPEVAIILEKHYVSIRIRCNGLVEVYEPK